MKKQTITEGWLKLVSDGYYTHALTLKPNSIKPCDFNDNVLFERLYRFHGLFDDALVGRRFYKEKNKHLRTQIIAVAEGNNDTGHLHCAIRVHETLLSKLNEMFPADLTNAKGKQLWNKVSVGGTVVMTEITTADGWARYIAKSLFGDNLSDRVRFFP